MTYQANTAAAKALGSIAFASGKMGSPVMDADFMETIKSRKVGDPRTIKEMKAWIAGWTQASLAA